MTKNSTDAILLSDINKRYGDVQALSAVSLTVPAGSFFGLLGPNGAGKTTLIGVLGGLVRPDSGQATILGYPVTDEDFAYKRQVGIVTQELLYDPFFTTREALIFQSKYFGLWKNHEWIDYLLDRLHLRDKAHINTRRLSGGMKRRLMIAQALVHRPPVIILDEPTAGVDINLRLTLWEFIRELKSDGRTIVLTTHYLEEAEELCDEVALMRDGQIVARDTTAHLLSSFEDSVKVRVKMVGAAKGQLPPFETQEDWLVFSLPDCGHIAPLLAELSAAGGVLTDMEISRADLEDVFVAVMGGTTAGVAGALR